MLNSNDIQKIIPHRYPFLLVDKVLEMDAESIVAVKNVSANEMHFVGHFPEKHVMPGVLIMEALAQAGAIVLLRKPEFKGKIAYFAGLDKVKFRAQVLPGDTLILKVQLERLKGVLGIASGKAYVDDKLVASGTLKFAVND